jgi:catechol 2,3-dioxygenase-like lactoylglutathione lyase family enzyme
VIDHTGLTVADVASSKAFYRAALGPLGYALIMEWEQYAGFGVPPKPDFWIGQGKPNVPPIHVAFRAQNRKEVDAFYKAAMAAGGRDNGPPGLRPHYHENYYGAFVLDPDGHNVEAVCHTPE